MSLNQTLLPALAYVSLGAKATGRESSCSRARTGLMYAHVALWVMAARDMIIFFSAKA